MARLKDKIVLITGAAGAIGAAAAKAVTRHCSLSMTFGVAAR